MTSNSPRGEVLCIQFATWAAQAAAFNMDDVLATVDARRRRFTVEECYRMAEGGILTDGDRVELNNRLVSQNPVRLEILPPT